MKNFPAGGIVVDHQDLQTAQVGFREYLPVPFRSRFETGGKGEFASDAELTGHTDSPTHHFHQTFAYGQAQTCPSVSAGD